MPESYEKDIIFILTKNDVLACASELEIPGEQVTDSVIKLVKRRVNSAFGKWPKLVKDALRVAVECPLGLVCYSSCSWWKCGKCTFPRD